MRQNHPLTLLYRIKPTSNLRKDYFTGKRKYGMLRKELKVKQFRIAVTEPPHYICGVDNLTR